MEDDAAVEQQPRVTELTEKIERLEAELAQWRRAARLVAGFLLAEAESSSAP